ncbi:MAG: formate dehydrogenase accessory protein FdhE [Burkholderiales bacterium]|nr:formate dehydrogenase accessory protein FdhE [Burkholderiales bacterium]
MQRILQPGEIESLDRVDFPRLRLPEPATLFQERAARLLQLAEGHPIAEYLRFAARLAQAQQRQAARLSAPAAPADEERLRRAREHGMPLWPAREALPPQWCETLRALLADLASAPDHAGVPAALRAELERLAGADDAALGALAQRALGGRLRREDLAGAPIVMAALQVGFANRAAATREREVPADVPPTVCPLCGSEPVASVLRIGGAAGGHRYLHCGLCASEWHLVRVKCSHCESTEGVRYQGAERAEGPVSAQTVLAETCDHCHTYRKLVNQDKDPLAEPLADDLASLTLDLLMAETAYARASANPLLALAEVQAP